MIAMQVNPKGFRDYIDMKKMGCTDIRKKKNVKLFV